MVRIYTLTGFSFQVAGGPRRVAPAEAFVNVPDGVCEFTTAEGLLLAVGNKAYTVQSVDALVDLGLAKWATTDNVAVDERPDPGRAADDKPKRRSPK